MDLAHLIRVKEVHTNTKAAATFGTRKIFVKVKYFQWNFVTKQMIKIHEKNKKFNIQ
jgi:hypothetical protein